MKQSYSQQELEDLLAATPPRVGWDFSRINDLRPAVPWEYADIATQYARSSDDVLDIGTGDGARFRALGLPVGAPPISSEEVADAGLRLISFREYDVEYLVRDIESLVFWLNALDLLHADLDGAAVLASADALNTVLAGNVDESGFVTNEHRYLVVAQLGG